MSKLSRSHSLSSCGVALAIAAALAPATAVAASKPRVTTGDYPARFAIKPTKFTAGSGVGGGVAALSQLRWSWWGHTSAKARGTLKYNICEPMCASGNYKRIAVTVRLSAVREDCELSDGRTAPYPLFVKVAITGKGIGTWRTIASDTQTCQ